MLDTKEQKQIFAGSVALVIILAAISFWSRPNIVNQPLPVHKPASQPVLDEATYKKYLQSLQINPEASQQLFAQLITQDDIKKQVESELQVSQKVIMPDVAHQLGQVVNQSGQAVVLNYLKNSASAAADFSDRTANLNQQLFSGDAQASEQLKNESQAYLRQLSQLKIPRETVELQKSLLTMATAYSQLASSSQAYAQDQSFSPWAELYKNYAIINSGLINYNQQFNSLVKKYQLAESVPVVIRHYAAVEPQNSRLTLVPTAYAILGAGDTTITVGDIPAQIRNAIQDGLVASFSQFMGQFLQKLVSKIESNYLISNFLYYSDALVNGEYADDYLNKYVSDQLDRQIIKKFIPQFSCNQNNGNLKPIFQAKANQYLGFDPDNLSLSDPDYYTKLARVGDFLSAPDGWQIYYQDMAAQTESEAQRAADRELTSSGLKSPRDTIKNQITLSINGIVSAEQASLNAAMNLGIANAKEFISKFVAQLTQDLFTKFVFQGASSPGATIGVLKEQATCLATAQAQVLIPVSAAVYTEPSAPPSSEDLINQACSQFARGCSGQTTTGK